MRSSAALAVLAPLLVALAVGPAPALAQADASARVVGLDEAIALALERSPAAAAAQGEVTTAGADLLEARGAWLPSISSGLTFSNSSNERFDQSTGRLVSESYTAQLQAAYEIFTGGQRLADTRAAVAGVQAAEAAARGIQFETVLETTVIFFTAAAAEIVTAAVQRLGRARQQLDFAETRLRLGTATRSDFLRAEIEVGSAELLLLEAESARRTARLALGRRIGEAEPVEPEPGALPDAAPDRPPLDKLVAWAVEHSPEVTSARAQAAPEAEPEREPVGALLEGPPPAT